MSSSASRSGGGTGGSTMSSSASGVSVASRSGSVISSRSGTGSLVSSVGTGSVLSSLSKTSSVLRRRRDINGAARRETPTRGSADEPHPYGLELRPVTPQQSSSSGSSMSTSSATMFVQKTVVTETSNVVVSGRRSNARSSNSVVLEGGGGGGGGGKKASAWRESHHEEYVETTRMMNNNGSSQRGGGVRRTTQIIEGGSSPYSSDSEGDASLVCGSERDVSVSGGSVIASVVGSVKRFFLGVCTYIYLFLVGIVYFEKWCLYVQRKRGDVDVAAGVNGQGGSRYHFSSASGTQSSSNDYSSSQEQSSSSASQYFTSSAGGAAAEAVYVGIGDRCRRNRIHRLLFAENSSSSSSSSMMGSLWSNDVWGSVWRIFKILMRLALVILLIYLFWRYGGYLMEGLLSGYQAARDGIGSALSSVSSGLTSSIGFLAASTTKSKQLVDSPKDPSSEKTEKVLMDFALARKVEEYWASLKTTQETVDALVVQFGAIEKTVGEHGTTLSDHGSQLASMESKIASILAAMKAVSAKEKSIDQIIDEVVNVNIGETTDGVAVSLKTIFNVLKEDRQRISNELEIKLRSLAEDINNKNEDLFHGLSGGVDDLKSEVSQVKLELAGVNKIQKEMQEQRSEKDVKVDVDMEKVKEMILPVLLTEIAKNVAISCETRSCPEGLSLAGLSTEDIELMIKRAFAKYDADKTGLPDLALESAGGSILSTRCTKSSELRNSVISYWGFRLWSPPNTPRTIIQPGVVPGECWAFEGSVGDVVIKLAVPALVTGFTLEHIPKTISRYGHIDSAPKHFQVLGLMSEHDTEEVHDYGTFTYEDNEESLQYFAVSNMTSKPYPIVELKVLSNHGNMKHTCIYRFRVHGAIDLGGSQGKGSKSTEDGNSSR